MTPGFQRLNLFCLSINDALFSHRNFSKGVTTTEMSSVLTVQAFFSHTLSLHFITSSSPIFIQSVDPFHLWSSPSTFSQNSTLTHSFYTFTIIHFYQMSSSSLGVKQHSHSHPAFHSHCSCTHSKTLIHIYSVAKNIISVLHGITSFTNTIQHINQVNFLCQVSVCDLTSYHANQTGVEDPCKSSEGSLVETEVLVNTLIISIAPLPANLWTIGCMDRLGRKFFLGEFLDLFYSPLAGNVLRKH